MNFFRRISSFANNSWRDFVDSQESEDIDSDVKTSENLENEIENNFIKQRKSLSGFLLRKRTKGLTKKSITKPIDDPRSPTNDFARTPIFAEISTYSVDALSPFNVKEMLEAVETAIEHPDNTLIDDEVNSEMAPLCENIFVEEAPAPTMEIKQEEPVVKIEDICNWNDMEFKEKPLSDSLIVETSDLTVHSVSPKSIIDHPSSELWEGQLDDKNCKVIGYCVKDDLPKAPVVDDENLKTSTPKKDKTSKGLMVKNRTPLMSIGNSPLIQKQNVIPKKLSEINKPAKKKMIAVTKRRLPKAPSTPMTPLNRVAPSVADFDKENF